MASTSSGKASVPETGGNCRHCGVEYWDVETVAECGHLQCHGCVKKWSLGCNECQEEDDNQYRANYKPTWGDLQGTDDQCKFTTNNC